MRPARTFLAERSGASAVEFALILPFVLLLMLGGYAISEAVTIGRKVTITTRALADLTSRYASMLPSDVSLVLNASQQIIAPFSVSPMSMRLSEVTTSSLCIPLVYCTATVTWSTSSGSAMPNVTDGSAYPIAGSTSQNLPALPPALWIANTSYILSQVSYSYSPAPVYNTMGPYTIADQIFMLPRISNNIPCPGC